MPASRRRDRGRTDRGGKERDAGGLDFTAHMRRLCEDICRRTPELRHVRMDRVAVTFRQTRKAVSYGLQASLTPLRFEGGARFAVRRGRKWGVQRVLSSEGREMLYVLAFYLPRFLNHPLEEKLTTVFHELWHISPECDGDLRRHPGRCYVHSHSQKDFDAHSQTLAKTWLALGPPEEVYDFLRYDFAGLRRRFGAVFGTRVAAPKLTVVE